MLASPLVHGELNRPCPALVNFCNVVNFCEVVLHGLMFPEPLSTTYGLATGGFERGRCALA